MPFVLAIIALLLIIAGVRNQLGTLFNLAIGDFTGQGNFIYFVAAIIVVGSIGYIDKLKPVSDAFLVLIIVVLFLHNKGVFANFMASLGTVKATSAPSQSTFGSFGSLGTIGGFE